MQLLLVMLGGALGTGARYLVNVGALQAFGPRFPWATLIVNVVGSFFISLVIELSLRTTLLEPTMRVTLVTGVLGGFTTYSAFNFETLSFLRRGAWALATLNLAGTVILCLLAGLLGLAAAKAIA